MNRHRINYFVKLHKGVDGWRWRMVDKRNGLIVGAATQGYSRKADCESNLETVTGYRED